MNQISSTGKWMARSDESTRLSNFHWHFTGSVCENRAHTHHTLYWWKMLAEWISQVSGIHCLTLDITNCSAQAFIVETCHLNNSHLHLCQLRVCILNLACLCLRPKVHSLGRFNLYPKEKTVGCCDYNDTTTRSAFRGDLVTLLHVHWIFAIF